MKKIIALLTLASLTAIGQNFEIKQEVVATTNIVITTPELTEAQVEQGIDVFINIGASASRRITVKELEHFSIDAYERPVKVFITNTVPEIVTIIDTPAEVDTNGVVTVEAVTHRMTNMVERVELTYQTLRTFKTDLKLK